jgi:small GTP-binding protein
MPDPVMKKICLVGDFAVGKTSLVRRFVDKQFSDEYLSTVGVKISRKLVEVAGHEPAGTLLLQLLLWDIQGGEQFKSIEPAYLKGASGAIFVADLSRPGTIEHLDSHMKQFFSLNPGSLAVVALNKADLWSGPAPDAVAPFRNAPRVLAACLTSAKTGDGVEQTFQMLGNGLLRQ